MSTRRLWTRRAIIAGLFVLACQQTWRHGRKYVLAERFAEVVPGKVYRGAWQRDWPMRRIVRENKIKTIVALAHPADHPLSVSEKALAEELGVKWVHLPIVDLRGTGKANGVFGPLEEAAAVIADPANQPVYFHCHHGINRASMAQMAYRMLHCGWSLDQAADEISRTFGLVAVHHGPDYRIMTEFYKERVAPLRSETTAKLDGHGKPTAVR